MEAVEVVEEVEEKKGPSLTRRPLPENQDGEEVSAVTKSSCPTSEAETEAGGRASGSVLRSESCHYDRASNDEFNVEF